MRKNFSILALALFFVTAWGVNAWAQDTASINIIKYVSVDGGITWHNADTIGEAPTATVGQGVMYKMEVTNDGGQYLEWVEVEDTALGIEEGIGYVGGLSPGQMKELLPPALGGNIEQLNQPDRCAISGEFENIAYAYAGEVQPGINNAWVICSESVSEGCTRTFGYWKTHSQYGPAPYDETWDLKEGGNAAFFGTGLSYYEILSTKPKGGNAYIILAHQFIATELNELSDASMPDTIYDALDEASVLLSDYQAYEIPKENSDRNRAIELSEMLDAYNKGTIGPGHCSN